VDQAEFSLNPVDREDFETYIPLILCYGYASTLFLEEVFEPEQGEE
jgi:hypothetical protein